MEKKTQKQTNKSGSALFIFETFPLGFTKCIMLLKGGCIFQTTNKKTCALCTMFNFPHLFVLCKINGIFLLCFSHFMYAPKILF